jgi:hypothetical protein
MASERKIVRSLGSAVLLRNYVLDVMREIAIFLL